MTIDFDYDLTRCRGSPCIRDCSKSGKADLADELRPTDGPTTINTNSATPPGRSRHVDARTPSASSGR
jgi:hypothetical protein